LNDPKIGPYFQVNQAVKDIGGEQNLQKFNLDAIKGNFPDDFKTYFSNMSKNMASQYNMKTTGIPYTFNDVIDNLKKNNVSDGKFNQAVLGEVSKIADKSIPDAIRENYALAAFSQGNRGMISRLQADGVDSKGKPLTAQSAVFQKFTSPEITHAMYELGKKNPDVWNQYTGWAKDTLGSELINKDVKDLGNIPESSGVSVGWDAKNLRFMTQYNGDPREAALATQFRGGSNTGPSSYYAVVDQTVQRMNANLYNYKRIAEASGEDPTAFVIKAVADSAGPEALRNVTGIPYRLMRDIGLSRMNFMQNAR